MKASGTAEAAPAAGILRRLAALLYDAFLVAAIWMLLGFLILMVAGTESNRLVDGRVQTDPLMDWLLFIMMLLSSFAFYAYFWIRSGQTLGMIAWRIKVEADDGATISLIQAVKRYLFAWLSFGCFFTGYLWALFDPRGDALHDRLSNSRVVLLPKSARPF